MSGRSVRPLGGVQREVSPDDRVRAALFCMACVGLVFVAHLPGLRGEFVGWDDPAYVTDNPLVRDLSPEGVRRIFTSYVSGNYHPLTILVYAAEYRAFGLDPTGYHAVSLLLHLLNGLLVYRAARSLGLDPAGSAAAMLVFGVHPQRVESVAWISGLKDLLAASFSLGCIVAYVSFRQTSSIRAYVASLCLYLLACLSKATAVTVPFLLWAVDFLGARPCDRSASAEKAPFLASAAVFGLLAVAARGSYEWLLKEGGGGFAPRVLIGCRRFFLYYLERFANPWANSFLFDPSLHDAGDYLALLIPLAAFSAVLVALLVLSLRRTRAAAFGFLFFLIALSPSLLAANVGLTADRFSYLPSFGLSFTAGAAASGLLQGLREGRRIAAAALLSGLLVVAAFSVRTWRQTAVWKDDVSLWTEFVRIIPETPPLRGVRAGALHDRGVIYMSEVGDYPKAVADFDAALRIDPSMGDALLNRSLALRAMGRPAEALETLDRAQSLYPGHPGIYAVRAEVRLDLGDRDGARADAESAIRIGGEIPPALAERLGLRSSR